MIPQVDFYRLTSEDPKEINKTVCQFVEKFYQSKQSIYLYCATKEQADMFDELLWTFKDLSFIPHECAMESQTFEVLKVYIGFVGSPEPKSTFDVLINLTETAYDFSKKISPISHVIEFVPNDSKTRSTAREKYKVYQKEGCKLSHHS